MARFPLFQVAIETWGGFVFVNLAGERAEPLAEALGAAGVERSKIEVTPNGVDPTMFPARPRTHDRRFTIGFAGSLKPWHGVDVLLRAFALAAGEERSLRLQVVGAGPEASLVEGAKFPPGTFAYLGQRSHSATLAAMRRWHAGAAPFLPLRSFYFSPLKVVEYMAAGLCPVVSDLGQLRTLLGDGVRGVLVPAGDVEALAAAFVGLARDRERAAALGARARAHALRHCTWEQNARSVLAAADAVRAERAA
jgi:glycosyltransferase involved in cell wall biosynthesis